MRKNYVKNEKSEKLWKLPVKRANENTCIFIGLVIKLLFTREVMYIFNQKIIFHSMISDMLIKKKVIIKMSLGPEII